MDDATARIPPKEVFDSSKYNAMSDMTKGSNRETRNVETLAETQQGTNSMKSEPIDNESIMRTTTASASSSSIEEQVTPKITPMMVEERARTIREVNEQEEMQQHLSSSTSSSYCHINLKKRRSLSCISISCFQ